MTDRQTIGCYWQRLQPPFATDPVDAYAVVYQNAVVVEVDGGERLVFDRDELASVVERPRPRAA